MALNQDEDQLDARIEACFRARIYHMNYLPIPVEGEPPVSIVARKSFLATLFALGSLLAVVGANMNVAHAQPKPKPACGIKALPLIEGQQWIYTPVAPPEEIAPTARKIAANKPKQADKVTIKVVSVVPIDRTSAEITLEETAHELTKTTKLKCTRDSIDVPPQSFFFTGEPGGGLAMDVGAVERPEGEHSYVFQFGQLRVPEWLENIKAPFTRTPGEGTGAKLANGSLDLQRVLKRGGLEPVTTLLGTFDATPVQVELVGSVLIDMGGAEPEKFGIPANTLSKLWMTDGVGVVQVFNSNGHMYQLQEATLSSNE